MKKNLLNFHVKFLTFVVLSLFFGAVGAVLVNAAFSQDSWSAYGAVGTWVTGGFAGAIAWIQFKESKRRKHTLRSVEILNLKNKTGKIALNISHLCTCLSGWGVKYSEVGPFTILDSEIKEKIIFLLQEWPSLLLNTNSHENFDINEIDEFDKANFWIGVYKNEIIEFVEISAATPNNYKKVIQGIEKITKNLIYLDEEMKKYLEDSIARAKEKISEISHGL